MISAIVDQAKRVVMYSLEMTKEKVFIRLASMRNGVSTNHLEKGLLKEEETKQILDDVGGLPLRVVNTDTYNLNDIVTDIVRENQDKGTEIFVVDYIQHIETGEDENEYRAMSLAIREFQKVATKLNVSIIVLSQMANNYLREKQPGSVPLYKGSGNIFFVANVALEVDYELKPEALEQMRFEGAKIPKRIYCHKNRDGSINPAYFLDDGATGKMSSIERSDYERQVKSANDNVDQDAVDFFNDLDSHTGQITSSPQHHD
jgi:RecA-family ATPase